MPTDDRLYLTAASARLRAQVDQLRRSILALRPAVRWGLALAILLGFGAAVYWAGTSLSAVGVRYLASGKRLYSDDLIMVCRALDKQRIDYDVDDHRVKVVADQYEQAAELIAKLDLGQHPISELRDASSAASIFDPPSEREHKKQLAREKIMERLVGQLDGVGWALVSINRPPASKWSRSSPKPTAFVYIETEGKRQLPSQTVQSIPAILTGCEPELTPGSITVMDRRGVRYFDSGNLAVGDNSRNRAREEELCDEILEKLEWIKGARVQVKLTTPRTIEPVGTVTGNESMPAGALEHAAPTRPDHPSREPDSGGAVPEMRINHPLENETEPRLVRTQPPAPTPAPDAAKGSSSSTSNGARSVDQVRQRESGRVLIHVPRSYYLNADLRTDYREPSREELFVLAERTENQIREVVSLILPEPDLWKVDIFTIPDEVSWSRPVLLPSATDSRHRALDWGIVGTVVAVVSILAAVGSWIQGARRPARLPEPALKTRHYHADSASEPGPSERVRELVRRNPDAAVSVLQRWTGQGGRDA
jgi:hypothetical protein